MRTLIYPTHESATAASRGTGAAARRGLAVLTILGSLGCAGSGAARQADAAIACTPGLSAAGIVEGVQCERFAAMVAVDRPKLERMLADSLRYCRSNGRCETKAEFLANLFIGANEVPFDRGPETAAAAGGHRHAGAGGLAIQAQQAGEPLSLRLSFTDVYELRAGIWQMVAWQSTRLP